MCLPHPCRPEKGTQAKLDCPSSDHTALLCNGSAVSTINSFKRETKKTKVRLIRLLLPCSKVALFVSMPSKFINV